MEHFWDSLSENKNLRVGGQQVAMLNMLLAASFEREKLEVAVRNILRNLNARLDASPCNQAAVDTINNRLKQLPK